MSEQTQQAWAFRIGDGATTEVFTQLVGMYELPEFNPNTLTTRDATTVDVAQTSTTKKYKFNRQKDGAELAISVDWLPGEATMDRLISNVGVDAGVNVQIQITGTVSTYLWEFNALVVGYSVQVAASNDDQAVERATFTLKVNSDVTETIT